MPDSNTPPPFALLGIDHIVLTARDAAALADFYCRVFGCELVRTVDDIGLLQLRAGDALIDIVPRQTTAANPRHNNMDHFCLRIHPFDAAVLTEHLHAHGVPCGEVTQRFGAQGVGDSLYCTDPEGNTVELKAVVR